MSTITPITANVLRQYAAGASEEDRARLRQNIREFVGQTFFGTVMKQMRSEMNPDNPLNGGKMAQTFGTQLDQVLISRWAKTARFEAADKIAQQWTGDKGNTQE